MTTKFLGTDYEDKHLEDLRAAGREGTAGFLLAMTGKQTSYLVTFTHRANPGLVWDNMRFAANTAAEAIVVAKEYTKRIVGWDIIRVTAKDSCTFERFQSAMDLDAVTVERINAQRGTR